MIRRRLSTLRRRTATAAARSSSLPPPASSLTLTIDDIAPRTTVDRRYAETTVLPAAITEIAGSSIATPAAAPVEPECRNDLVELDGRDVPILVTPASMAQLLAGSAVTVQPCDGAAVDLAAGTHQLSTAAGTVTGLDVDQIVLRSGQPDPGQAAPTVTVERSRTTRKATVAGCPAGCWLILGEGYNDGWRATLHGSELGAPRQISGGFNGWRLPGSVSPVTVTMTWEPQRTMWAGMAVAALGSSPASPWSGATGRR